MAAVAKFYMDPFCERQFQRDYRGGSMLSGDPTAFASRVCDHDAPLVDGYAPFCKHVFVPNFVDAKVSYLPITAQNQHLLKSDYEARTPKELPVLVRWFPSESVEVPVASHLDVILYSREQIILEREAMGDATSVPDSPWGIISVKAQNESYETPMQPITMMRNALGKAEGGSGVPLDADKYRAAVAFWQLHGTII